MNSWLAINSNREGTEYYRVQWTSGIFSSPVCSFELISDNMIYKALVAFVTNEMPASLWQNEGDGCFKNKNTDPWCVGFLRKLGDNEQNLATRYKR